MPSGGTGWCPVADYGRGRLRPLIYGNAHFLLPRRHRLAMLRPIERTGSEFDQEAIDNQIWTTSFATAVEDISSGPDVRLRQLPEHLGSRSRAALS